MSRILRPEEVAIILQTNLNELAVDMYEAGLVTDKIVFNITADFQLYERLQTEEYQVDDYQDFTPAIIARTQFYQTPADYIRYEETYDFRVYGYSAQLDSLERILKQFTSNENTVDQSVVESGFRITKAMEDVSFDLDLYSNDGTLEKRVEGLGSINWNFLEGPMTSFDVDIFIDGVNVPYLQYGFVDSNRTIANSPLTVEGSNGLKSVGFYGIQLTLPYISTSPTIVGMYQDFYSGVYNKTYTFDYVDSAGVTFTYDVIVQDKSFVDTVPKILDFTVTLVRSETQIDLTIDGAVVPVLAFSINSGSTLETYQNINSDEAENAYLGSAFEIDMEIDISDTDNPKVQEILQTVLSRSFGTEMVIAYTKGAITASWPVLLKDGNYSFDTNPEEKVTLKFVKSDSEA